MSRTVTLVLVSGAIGKQSTTARLGTQLYTEAGFALRAADYGVEGHTIYLPDHAADLARVEIGAPPDTALSRDLRLVERADAVIAISPVYNASYSGLFKAFFDAVDPNGLIGTTVLLAAVGSSLRHSLMVDQVMRPLFAFFQARTVPTAVFATSDSRPDAAAPRAQVDARALQAVSELVDLVHAERPTTVSPQAVPDIR